MFCGKCGQKNIDQAKFCQRCGNKLIQIPQPVNQQPANQQPVNQQPVNQQPANPQPVNKQPANQQPANPQPVNKQPANQQPANPQPVNKQPVNQQPANPQPVNQQPVNQQPANPQPVNQQPVNQQPANPQPVNQQPANQQPANPQPVNKQPVNQQPVNQQPVNPQPVNQQPTNVQPGGQQQGYAGQGYPQQGNPQNNSGFSKPANPQNNSGVSKPANPNQIDFNQLLEKLKRIPIAVWIAACAAVVVLIVAMGVMLHSSSTINLNKYLTIEADGSNGYGIATARIDWAAIEKKYGKKVRFTRKAKKQYKDYNFITPIDVLEDYVSVELDQTSDLSNGTVVTYKWNIDKEYNIKGNIKFKDDSYTISGLEEVGTFDAFSDLEVSFEGIAPDGQITWNYNGEKLYTGDFICDKTSGLNNGDTVTITIDDRVLDYCVEMYNSVPATMEKQYTVEGLNSYLTQLSQVDEESLKAMQQQAADVFDSYVAKEWTKEVSLQTFTYIGDYLLVAKDEDGSWGNTNTLYLVYKVQSKIEYKDEDKSFSKNVDGYWYISFRNLMVDGQGKLLVDVTAYDTPVDDFKVEAEDTDWSSPRWYFSGFETLDDLYKTVVTANADVYTHEDNVDESVAPASAPQEKKSKKSKKSSEKKEIKAGNSDYIIPNSDSVALTKDDIKDLTLQELNYAKNEIYARHGRKFESEELKAYFEGKSWYKGTIDPKEFNDNMLSQVERDNIKLIKDLEFSLNPNGYELDQ